MARVGGFILFNACYEADLNAAMLPLVYPMITVALFELDAVASDAIYCAHVHAIAPMHIFSHLLPRHRLLRSDSCTHYRGVCRV
jgi:hypothetical protein